MKAKSIASSIFAWLFGAPILGAIIYGILVELGWVPDTDESTMAVPLCIALIILIFIFGVYYSYSSKKKDSTCPRCKESFCWYEKQVDSETLSEAYVSEDVKKTDNNNRTYYERQAFRVGKRRYFYATTCTECGYRTSRESVGSYKERV